MQKVFKATSKISEVINSAGGVILVLMMLVAVVDVIFRYLGRPITGTFELVALAGAIVTGFAVAQTSLDGAHVNMDMLGQALSAQQRDIVRVFTKLIGVGIFALLTWALFLKGNDLYETRELTLTLRVPYYPVAYALSLSSLVECLVLLSDILRTIFGGNAHE